MGVSSIHFYIFVLTNKQTSPNIIIFLHHIDNFCHIEKSQNKISRHLEIREIPDSVELFKYFKHIEISITSSLECDEIPRGLSAFLPGDFSGGY